MSITIGSQASDSTWQVAWDKGAANSTGATISLSSLAGKVVVLYLTDTTEL